MTTNSLHAWVLHKQWSGDTSARVIFFTREAGIVHCLCKGGRTPKKQSLLQAFTPLWLSLNERSGCYYLQTVESVSPMLLLEGNALFSALYMNEILYYTLSPSCPDSVLFDAYLFTLNGLALTNDRMTIEALLRRFEWSLLVASGQSFEWTQEARTGNNIMKDAYYQFVPGEGLVRVSQGIPGEHILALSADNLNEEPYLKSAKIIMRQAINHLIGGKEIKARVLYS